MEPKELNLSEAIKLCEEKGLPVTREVLYSASRSRGIGEKRGTRYVFFRTKLVEYIGSRIDKAPDGWIPLTEAAQKFNYGEYNIRYGIRVGKLEKKTYTKDGKRIPYVNEIEVKNYSERYSGDPGNVVEKSQP